jgi:hypothetical protein
VLEAALYPWKFHKIFLSKNGCRTLGDAPRPHFLDVDRSRTVVVGHFEVEDGRGHWSFAAIRRTYLPALHRGDTLVRLGEFVLGDREYVTERPPATESREGFERMQSFGERIQSIGKILRERHASIYRRHRKVQGQ